jgi:hypothetical protein
MKILQVIDLNPHEILDAVSLYLQKKKPETCDKYSRIKYNFPIDFKGFRFELFNDEAEVTDEKNSRSEHKRLIRVEDETKEIK